MPSSTPVTVSHLMHLQANIDARLDKMGDALMQIARAHAELAGVTQRVSAGEQRLDDLYDLIADEHDRVATLSARVTVLESQNSWLWKAISAAAIGIPAIVWIVERTSR